MRIDVAQAGPEAAAAELPPRLARSRSRPLLHAFESTGLLMLALLVGLFFSVLPATSAVFPTVANIQATAANQSVLVIVALAALVPLVIGAYDLSVGAIAGLASILTASAFGAGHSLLLCCGIGLSVGLAVGLANGLIVATVRVDPLIVTLGTATILHGIAFWITNGESLVKGIPTGFTDFGSGLVLGVPAVLIPSGALCLAVYYLLDHTPVGRRLYFIGSNPRAARLVGLRIDLLSTGAFALGGLLAGCGGVLLVAVTGAGTPAAGAGLTLPALAAAFLSVAAIKLGRFNVWGTVVAIVFLATLNSGLNLSGANTYVTDLANGGALIIGVAISRFLGERRMT